MTETVLAPTARPGSTPLPSLAATVRSWAALRPDAPACTYVDYGADLAGSAETWTYAELDRRARAVAGAVQAQAGPADRVALLLPQGLDYLAAFLGCLYAGSIGVPLYAPDARRSDDRLTAALADARPALTLTSAEAAAAVGGLPATGRVLTVGAAIAAGATWSPPVDGGDRLAYLQYTSGSTRRPAGVMVTDDNLAVACAQLRGCFGIGDTGPVVSWLPFFHDMGLVMTVSAPLQAGGHAVYLSPYAFVRQPVRWLRLMHEHRAASTAAPNFGLDLAVGRVTPDQRAGLDLSSLVCLVNGSEPIRARSLRAFSETYAPYGFQESAHRPGYGLAEATLVVSGTPATSTGPRVTTFDRAALAAGRGVPAPDGTALVSCGVPWEQDVRIVDPGTGAALGDGVVGEVWVRGPNVCPGYYERPEETAEVFDARSAGAGPDRGGWLRTGDLGLLHSGELHITARLKDLIIVAGSNHYPADLESTVDEAVDAVRTGHVTAFPVEVADSERLVLVAEIEPRLVAGLDFTAVRAAIRGAVAHRHEIDPHEILLVRTGTIPKTTSGKLQRRECRARYLSGALDAARLDRSALAHGQ